LSAAENELDDEPEVLGEEPTEPPEAPERGLDGMPMVGEWWAPESWEDGTPMVGADSLAEQTAQ
jgi:hypothetical protein